MVQLNTQHCLAVHLSRAWAWFSCIASQGMPLKLKRGRPLKLMNQRGFWPSDADREGLVLPRCSQSARARLLF